MTHLYDAESFVRAQGPRTERSLYVTISVSTSHVLMIRFLTLYVRCVRESITYDRFMIDP